MKANQRKLSYNAQYDAQNYKSVVIQVRRDSGVLEALEARLEGTGMSKSDYIRAALIEKIAQDEGVRRV